MADGTSIADSARLTTLFAEILHSYGTERALGRNELLIRQGDEADCLFFVLQGRFDIRVGSRVVAKVPVGEPLGEIAFLTFGRRTADVVAARDSRVLEITRIDYERLVSDHPEFGREMATWLAARLGEAVAKIPQVAASVPRIVSLVGLTPEDLPPQLENQMRQAAPGWSVLTGDNPALGESEDACTARILEREMLGDRQLCLVRGDSPAERAMIRQSDLVVFCKCLPGGDWSNAPLENLARDLHNPNTLRFLFHRPRSSDAIQGTERFFTGETVTMHHHVALDCPGDFARFLRFLEGKARGVVLGGGGALGAGHIGVARALEEAGIEVDFWGGTSVGGAMAVAFARGLSPAEVLERTEEIFVTNKGLARMSLPFFGVLDHRNFDRQLQLHYGDEDLRNSAINVFTAATSLTTNDLQVFRDGPAWEAVRASGSLPMVVPPFIRKDGEVLIDGGIIDNLPIRLMRDLKAGPNALVNLSPDREFRVTSPYSTIPTGLAVIPMMLSRKRRRDLPPFSRILSRSMVVSSNRMMSQTDLGKDILLRPESVKGIKLMDWKRAREQEAAAYAYTTARIEAGDLALLTA